MPCKARSFFNSTMICFPIRVLKKERKCCTHQKPQKQIKTKKEKQDTQMHHRSASLLQPRQDRMIAKLRTMRIKSAFSPGSLERCPVRTLSRLASASRREEGERGREVKQRTKRNGNKSLPRSAEGTWLSKPRVPPVILV